MRRAAVISFLVTIVVLGLIKVAPFATGPTSVTESTPVPQPLAAIGEVKLRAGQRLCVANITLTPESRFAQFTLRGDLVTRSPVAISASSPGYSASGRAPAGSAGTLTARLDAPRREGAGKVCARNLGRRTIVLLGVPPGRGQTIASTTVDGRAQEIDASLSLYRSLDSSRTAAFPQMLERASAFSVFPAWLLWVLALALVLAVPACLAFALAKSVD